MRAFAYFSAVFVIASFASVAGAQSITIAAGYPKRAGTSRTATQGIDRNDCVRPFESWGFAFQLPSGVAFDDLEVWARATTGSCAAPTARSGAAKSCYEVAAWPAANVSGAQVVTTSSGAILEAIVGKTDVVDPTTIDRDTVCYPKSDEQATPVTLDFLLFSGGNVVADTTGAPYEGTFATTYDRGMPAPPTGVTASVDASGVVNVSWDAHAPAPDVTAYHVYCFDLTGTDAGCIWPPEAQQHGFVAFQLDAAPCTSIEPTATNVLIAGLGRGRTYAMVVTAVDDAQNTGPISDVVCVSPQGNLVPAGSVDPGPAPDSNGCACRAATTRLPWSAAWISIAAAIALFFVRRNR